jgi:hypothetical protein
MMTQFQGEPLTKREVLVAREAYTRATGAIMTVDSRTAERWAAREYPLPKVTRPRVVTDAHGVQWSFVSATRFKDALLMAKRPEWTDFRNGGDMDYPLISLELAPVLADLLANPTEEVEDTEP